MSDSWESSADGARRRASVARGALLLLALLWLLLDQALFQLLVRLGLSLSAAQLASFSLVGAGLMVPVWRRSLEAVGAAGARFPGVSLACVGGLAMLLRAGPLVLVGERLGRSAGVALLPASMLSIAAACLGCALVARARSSRSQKSPSPGSLWAIGLVAYLFALRLVYIPVIGLLPDEAYYWQYAQHPDISYLDHPPLVAIAIAAGSWFFGHSELAVRLPALAFWLIGAGYLAALTKRVHGAASAAAVALLFSVLPVYFGAGMLMTTDILCLAAWAALLFYSYEALLCGRAHAWLGVGIAMGMGFVSKYSVALLGPAILLFALSDPRARGWLRRPHPYLAALLAGLIALPVLLWNLEHGLVSFSFQSSRRLAIPGVFSTHFLLLHMLILLSPVGAAAALAELLRPSEAGDGAGEPGRWRRFVWIFTLTPLSVFVYFSLDHYPRFHWTAPIWLATLPGVAHAMGSTAPLASRALRGLHRSWLPTCVLLTLLYAGVLQHLALALPGLGYPKAADYYFWREATPVVQRLAREVEAELGEPPVVVGMAKWSIASALTFYDSGDQLGPVTARHLFKCAAAMYETWLPPETAVGRPLLLIGHKRTHLEAPYIDDRLEEASEVRVREVRRHGRPLRRVMYRVAGRYTGPDSPRGIDPPPFECGTKGPSAVPQGEAEDSLE